jgi:predicted alpha/beta-fold hydrolase
VRPLTVLLLAVLVAAMRATPATTHAAGVSQFQATVSAIEALPYQADYVPEGFDSAFPGQDVLNNAPAEDYTTGSIPDSPDLPQWPASFQQVTITSSDGAPLYAEVAMHPGTRPGIVVAHGFNTHGILSVIRWAAMLYANGYDVIASDQRDYSYEYSADSTYPSKWPQTFGWKESQDVLAAGRYLLSRGGVSTLGVVGFSEGAQNTVLALSQDTGHIFSAGITFSGPADQNTQIYSTAVPSNCQTPECTFPTTDALVALVVPPYTYTDPCSVLSDAAKIYGTTPYAILGQESAMHAQSQVAVPLLNFYAADDSLVAPVDAQLMSAFESGNPLQQTLEIQHGEHAYYFDRWWQQMAILTYFHAMLPTAPATTTVQATVNQTPGGAPLSAQLVSFPRITEQQANAMLAPFACDTSLPPPAE